ncbi:MAG: pyridoxamine 5'-phosphate oxidase family protein [Bacillota bacterium]|nr:pyridoxamine 5'-phosphate oxidase family protein [Bacillota bacterium]
MRKADKEIKELTEIEAILNRADVCRLALCNDGVPYIIPMNFAYNSGSLYVHCARQGKKLDIIRQNNNVCFEADEAVEIVKADSACNWGAYYRSVVGLGKISFIDSDEDIRKALDLIMLKYSGTDKHEYSRSSLDRIFVLRIDITEMTGKRSAPKQS